MVRELSMLRICYRLGRNMSNSVGNSDLRVSSFIWEHKTVVTKTSFTLSKKILNT
jgi:hypothetical protein